MKIELKFNVKKRKNQAPDFKVGDMVKVNHRSGGYAGRTGTVIDLRQIGDDWFVMFDTDGRILTLYAYKLDVVGRAAGFNNEMAWQTLMEGDDAE